MNIRKANTGDLEFVIDCIVESEKSGTEILSWSQILSIEAFETRQLIREVLEEEIEGQEWHLGHFYILEQQNLRMGGLSAWIEEANGLKSGILKAQAISWLFPEAWKQAEENLNFVQNLHIARLTGALQLENIYIFPEFRGKGLAGELINKTIESQLLLEDVLEFAEIQLMNNNTAALGSYTKCGFLKRMEVIESKPEILHLLPGNHRISLIRYLNDGNN